MSPLPWTGGSSVYGPHAQLFMPKLSATEIDDPAIWRAVDAFFSRLGGQAGLLRIGDASRLHPQYNVAALGSVQRWSDSSLFDDGSGFVSDLLPPTVFVAAAASRGESALQIGGLPASLTPALKRGDLLELRANGMPASFPHLYQVMVDGPTNTGGLTGVELRPSLRADVAVGDMVVLDYPTSVFRLVGDDQAELEISVPTTANFGFALVEALDQVP
ncbi:hypothetical protein [Bradyrhizobium sp. 156]|uniref:hypothetical protein n=1 Tax=Bradyrhizobium sp. 156 TaxID=2782630 RepID=UPI001FF90404|nr:hypothetical protein [Bradyrhizobium sp. 156]